MTTFIVLGLIALFVFRFQKEVRKGWGAAARASTPITSKLLPVPQVYKDILLKYFRFYQQLSKPNQEVFERRVVQFISGKQFIPRNIDEVTVEARVLIAATAVQLTFGLPGIYIRHFSKILVYPNDYYSSITKRYHKGEVNPRFGIIVLSWQSFVTGFIEPEDSVNLGLHEMAHALRLENIIRNEEFRFFDPDLLRRFDTYAAKVCEDIDSVTFFRPYACTNEHEFFSVAVENFFERSTRFQQELPELYAILVKLLGQDPIELTGSGKAQMPTA